MVLLAPIFKTEQVANVLELNCGTGEDAIWMANKVDHIEATDISEKMIQMAQAKVNQKIKNFLSSPGDGILSVIRALMI